MKQYVFDENGEVVEAGGYTHTTVEYHFDDGDLESTWLSWELHFRGCEPMRFTKLRTPNFDVARDSAISPSLFDSDDA